MPKWLGHVATSSESIPETEHWKEQWDRACRWYERCKEIEIKSLEADLSLDDQDIIITFFQNCYHVQDWIIASRKDLKSKIDEFVEANFEMKACRNISDGFKHKQLTSKKHPDPDFNWYVIFDPLEMGSNPLRSGMTHRLAFSNGTAVEEFDVFNLAKTCQGLWESFIKDNSL